MQKNKIFWLNLQKKLSDEVKSCEIHLAIDEFCELCEMCLYCRSQPESQNVRDARFVIQVDFYNTNRFHKARTVRRQLYLSQLVRNN